MEGNSYSNILAIMKEEGYNQDIKVRIGEVVSPSPLVVKLNGYEIEEEDVFISETIKNLIDDQIGLVTVTHLSGINDVEVEEVDIKVRPRKPLEAGDKVLVIIEQSDFFIVDRMV